MSHILGSRGKSIQRLATTDIIIILLYVYGLLQRLIQHEAGADEIEKIDVVCSPKSPSVSKERNEGTNSLQIGVVGS